MALCIGNSCAYAADMVVFSTTAAKSSLEALAPDFERMSQHKLRLRFAPAAELKAEIEKGAVCDVAVLTSTAVDDLVQQGKLAGTTQKALFRSGVGVAIRRGAPVPPIATTEEFKQTLLAAKSVAMTAQGATGSVMKRLFERLGIAQAMAPKTLMVSPISGPEAVVQGQADIALTQVSEILEVPGAQFAGPLPPELQVYSSFAAAMAVGSRVPEAAQSLLDALTSPSAKSTMQSKGLVTD